MSTQHGKDDAGDQLFEDDSTVDGSGEVEHHEVDENQAPVVLTPRQRKVLRYIRESIAKRGYPPSVREIGEAVGLKSPSSVAHQLSALECR